MRTPGNLEPKGKKSDKRQSVGSRAAKAGVRPGGEAGKHKLTKGEY